MSFSPGPSFLGRQRISLAWPLGPLAAVLRHLPLAAVDCGALAPVQVRATRARQGFPQLNTLTVNTSRNATGGLTDQQKPFDPLNILSTLLTLKKLFACREIL